MGTPVLPEWPVILNDKVYLVTVDIYWDESEKTGCDQDFVTELNCCATGLAIIEFNEEGKECVRGGGLCAFPAFDSQRLIAIHGPYVNMLHCQSDL